MQQLHSLRRTRRAGFSLAELMVVIVIIGLLATLVVPNVVSKLFVANRGKATADITAIAQAIDEYAVQNAGNYPESLERLVEKDEGGNSYLNRETVPKDPWGNEYFYEPPTSGQNYVVGTYAKDGQAGGEGDDRDLTNVMIRNGEE